MALSYTERKRLRADFGKRLDTLEVPPLLEIQLKSYKGQFLQESTPASSRENKGLEAAFRSIFPIKSFSGNAELHYVHYSLGEVPFKVSECQLRGLTYASPLRVLLRLVFFDKESGASGESRPVKDIREQEVYLGEVPIMTEKGTFVINGTERVVVSQLHRSPGVFFDHDKGKTHSSGKLLYSARIIPYRGSWLDFEFDPKDCIFVRIDRRRKISATILLRALGFTTEEILTEFFETNIFNISSQGEYTLELVPQRLRGETAFMSILDGAGNVIVEQGRRITARHVRDMVKAGLTKLRVPRDYLIGKFLAKEVIDKATGEILFPANTEIVSEVLEKLISQGLTKLETLYINDLDQGPYVSDTLRIDPTQTQLEALVEIYRMMRPGEPPTKEAAELLFNNLFFTEERYDLSNVGRMKFNRRVGRPNSEGAGVLSKEDILDVLKTLIGIRDGRGKVDDIDHLGNRRVRSVGEMTENQFRIGLIRVERAVKERLNLAESDNLMPQDLINAKPVSAAIKEFFGSF